MYQTGIITNIDQAGKVRVTFPDMDDMTSDWLQIVYPFTGKDKRYFMPSINEQVACIMDENCEAGCIIGSVYSDEDTPPVTDKNKFHTAFEDGTTLEYDKATHTLTADVKGIASIKATQLLINGKDLILVFNNHVHPTPNGTSSKPTEGF